MKINIRSNVFETNSSSMHSIIIIGNDQYIDKSKLPKHKRIDPDNMNFSWGPETRKTIYDRIGYAIAWAYSNGEEKDMIKKIQDILDMEIEYDESKYEDHKYGCIDHQSLDVLPDFLENSSLEEFITNDKYHIVIDHDNHYYEDE